NSAGGAVPGATAGVAGGALSDRGRALGLSVVDEFFQRLARAAGDPGTVGGLITGAVSVPLEGMGSGRRSGRRAPGWPGAPAAGGPARGLAGDVVDRRLRGGMEGYQSAGGVVGPVKPVNDRGGGGSVKPANERGGPRRARPMKGEAAPAPPAPIDTE